MNHDSVQNFFLELTKLSLDPQRKGIMNHQKLTSNTNQVYFMGIVTCVSCKIHEEGPTSYFCISFMWIIRECTAVIFAMISSNSAPPLPPLIAIESTYMV